jgi:signal recognition particle subunit SRP54
MEDAARMEERLRGGRFDLNDFLEQFKMLRKMGPLENLLGLIPGMDKMKNTGVDEKQMRRTEAIVLSMTPGERARPDVLNARRRQRIARGSGTTVTEVNNLLLRFSDMRKLMKKPGKLKKMMARAGGMGMLGRN